MESTTKQTLVIGAVIFFIFLVTAGIIIRRNRNYLPVVPPAEKNKSAEARKEDIKAEREKILATDPTDPSHINNIAYLQEGLKKYYAEKKMYPKKLGELLPRYLYVIPKYSSDKDYLYAYFPAEKPFAYHIGTLLGGRNIVSPQTLSADSDFNSEKVKYVNGFNGADPMYDIVREKGK